MVGDGWALSTEQVQQPFRFVVVVVVTIHATAFSAVCGWCGRAVRPYRPSTHTHTTCLRRRRRGQGRNNSHADYRLRGGVGLINYLRRGKKTHVFFCRCYFLRSPLPPGLRPPDPESVFARFRARSVRFTSYYRHRKHLRRRRRPRHFIFRNPKETETNFRVKQR